MKKQTYTNHSRYYFPHHFIFYPIVITGLILSISHYFKQKDCTWLFVAALFVIIGWLSFMLRQHYALILQDRIIRQEVRFRYYTLTGKRFEFFEEKLSFGQVLALRFAPDEELVALTQRAIDEKLSPAYIKKSIINWMPDNSRV